MITKKYWRPEPRLYGFTYWSLLLPAILYVIGTMIYGLEAMKAGRLLIGDKAQSVGSAFMVIGGELGTIWTAFEVFRKSQVDRVVKDRKGNDLVRHETNAGDWLGLLVSIGASMGTLFVIYARQATMETSWILFALRNGPWILLLCSVLDQAATVMELAFYRASFDRVWDDWNDRRHTYEDKDPRVANEKPPEKAIDVQAGRQFAGGIGEWRKLAANLNGKRATLTAKDVNEFLESQGFAPVASSTARYWAEDARRDTEEGE